MIYFDNSATTKPLPSVVEKMNQVLLHNWGNPSSAHSHGFSAKKEMEQAREQLASLLRTKASCLTFTSGGTEANNLAILGGAMALAKRGKHIITTQGEHPSVLGPIAALEKQGFSITRLPLSSHGEISLDDFSAALRPDTVFISIMMVNNELGTIHPLKEIVSLARKKSPLALIHSDGVQALGKIPLFPDRLGLDLLSVSSHKIHGPKGAGALFVAPGVRLLPQLHGGGQENNLRSGTENTLSIIGFGEAARLLTTCQAEEMEHLASMKQELIKQLQALPFPVLLNSPQENCAPHILSLSLPGIKSEVGLRFLAQREIFVSAGSACSSHKKASSHVLQACSLPPKQIDSTLRISFGQENYLEECAPFVQALCDLRDFF